MKTPDARDGMAAAKAATRPPPYAAPGADGRRGQRYKGRGSFSTVDARYLRHTREAFDDGWGVAPAAGVKMKAEAATWTEEQTEAPAPDMETAIKTEVTLEHPKTIISRNQSPDVPFAQSINPYRGCEHGCVYCYARPSHAYMDLSPGLDFESKLFVKNNAAALLRAELARPGYRCSPINLGANTDPYQPIERRYRVTREIIEVLLACRHPLTIVTKSCLVERDLDLLAEMAGLNLVKVFVSVTSLDHELARRLEPRATAPTRRLRTIRAVADAGVPVGVLFAPVIPFINDAELEAVLREARQAGAETAGYVMLRLPHEVKQLFREWLQAHAPDKERRVFATVADIRGGRENDPRFFSRMSGRGRFADLIRQRFRLGVTRYGYAEGRKELDTGLFTAPVMAAADGRQGALF